MLLPTLSHFCAGLRDSLLGRPARRRRKAAASRAAGRRSASSSALFLLGLLLLGLAASAVASGWVRRARPALPRAATPEVDPPHELGHSPEQVAASLEAILAIDPDATPRAWTAVVFHHSGTTAGGALSFDAYHRAQKGWKSLGYDFVIGNGTETPDGAIETGPRWRLQQTGAHAHSPEFNEHGIGICLVGNFDEQPPTAAQVRAAYVLLHELCRRFRIPRDRVFGHGQVREGGATACPGKLFPLDELLQAVPEG